MLAQQLKEFDIAYNPKDSILEKILKEGNATLTIHVHSINLHRSLG